MKPTFNDKLIAYLVLFSGLAISGVAEYYSIMGLMAIYPAALIPIVIMGVVLGIGKISGTVWLKQNWEWSPFFLKAYVLPAIIVLMLITSLGVFGFLSKAHSDQSLVSGDVTAKIAVYDTKIQTAKDNIDANRKALKQMDEAVDQVMGRSSDEKGADKAVGIRRAQQKERVRLQSEIAAEQKTIASLSEERAPIAAEVRKVEAEVGPIKYIAHLLYGENPDANILEKAVIWVTVLIVIVLDPLAVVLLLASQYSFQHFRKIEEQDQNTPDPYVADVGENSTQEEKDDFLPTYEEITPKYEQDDGPLTDEQLEQIQAVAAEELPQGEIIETKKLFEDTTPKNPGWMFPIKETFTINETIKEAPPPEPVILNNEKPVFDFDSLPPEQEYVMIDGQNMHIRAAKSLYTQAPKIPEGYVQNEEQNESGKWNRVISEAEYRDMAKNKNDSKNNPNNPT